MISKFMTKGSQGKNSNSVATWRQELLHSLWRTSYWLAVYGLLSLLSYRIQKPPG